MREVAEVELTNLSPAQLEELLLEQERSLRDLATASGFDSSSSHDEFMCWAKQTPQGRNIDRLVAAIEARGGQGVIPVLRRIARIAGAFAAISLFMWLASRV